MTCLPDQPAEGAWAPLRLRRTGLVAPILAAVLFSCGTEGPVPEPTPPPPAEPSWPAGACLAIDELTLAPGNVDRIAAWVALIKPTDTQPSLRRQALTHTLFERLALASRFAPEREAARAAATELLASLRAGEPAPAEVELGHAGGTWDDLGLVVWGETRDLEPDSWSGPFEDVGRWLLLRRTDHTPGTTPGADRFELDLASLPFVPPDFTRADVEATLDDALLTVIDPAWGDLVPAFWRLRMNGPE